MKCYSDDALVIPIDGLHIGAKLQIVEEPVEIIDGTRGEVLSSYGNVKTNSRRSIRIFSPIAHLLPMPRR
ncbi:hypothetical protein Tco_0314423 [Tanacetum coccineum]